MKKRFFLMIINTLLLGACEENREQLYGKNKIEGVVSLNDTLSDSPAEIAPEATIYLSTDGTADPYLLRTKADKDGKFSLEYLPKSGTYFLTGEYTNAKGVKFRGSLQIDTKKDYSLKITPRYPKGKFQVKVEDNAMPAVALKGVDVYLFVNQDQANTVMETSPKGIVQMQTTNERGIAFFYNLDEQKQYFIRAKQGTQAFMPESIITPLQNNFGTKTMKPTPPSVQLEVEVKYQNALLYGSEVYLFTNLAQAESIKLNPKGFVAFQKTDNRGIARFSNLSEIDYYIAARDSITENNERRLKFMISTTSFRPTNTKITRDLSL
jgi:hypothetical protein